MLCPHALGSASPHRQSSPATSAHSLQSLHPRRLPLPYTLAEPALSCILLPSRGRHPTDLVPRCHGTAAGHCADSHLPWVVCLTVVLSSQSRQTPAGASESQRGLGSGVNTHRAAWVPLSSPHPEEQCWRLSLGRSPVPSPWPEGGGPEARAQGRTWPFVPLLSLRLEVQLGLPTVGLIKEPLPPPGGSTFIPVCGPRPWRDWLTPRTWLSPTNASACSSQSGPVLFCSSFRGRSASPR